MTNTEELLEIVVRVSSGLSILGALSIFVSFIAFKRFRHVAVYRIFFFRSCADLLSAVSMFFGRWAVEYGGLCQLQGFAITWMTLASVGFTTALSINSILLFTRKIIMPQDLPKKVERWYQAVWPLTLIISLALLFASQSDKGLVFGDANLFCWIQNTYLEYRLWFFYVPVWVCALFNSTVFTWIHIRSRLHKRMLIQLYTAPTNSFITKQIDLERDSHVINYTQKVAFYLMVFFINWIPATISGIYTQIMEETPVALLVADGLITPLTGCFNAIVFFFIFFTVDRYADRRDSDSFISRRNSLSRNGMRPDAQLGSSSTVFVNFGNVQQQPHETEPRSSTTFQPQFQTHPQLQPQPQDQQSTYEDSVDFPPPFELPSRASTSPSRFTNRTTAPTPCTTFSAQRTLPRNSLHRQSWNSVEKDAVELDDEESDTSLNEETQDENIAPVQEIPKLAPPPQPLSRRSLHQEDPWAARQPATKHNYGSLFTSDSNPFDPKPVDPLKEEEERALPTFISLNNSSFSKPIPRRTHPSPTRQRAKFF